MREAFLDGHQEVIIANDDIVLDPDSYTKLLADRELLKAKGIKVGFLGARTNMSSLHMNVRNRLQTISGMA
jgi:GT2 family glycosyltransferase